MDTLGALALATEPPTDHLMRRAPVGRRSEFCKPFTVLILAFSTISTILLLVLNLNNLALYLI